MTANRDELIHLIEGLPGINVNAASIIVNLCMLVFMTCIAFGSSTATLVSQSLGAKNPELAARYGWQSVKLMVPVMALVGLVMITRLSRKAYSMRSRLLVPAVPILFISRS